LIVARRSPIRTARHRPIALAFAAIFAIATPVLADDPVSTVNPTLGHLGLPLPTPESVHSLQGLLAAFDHSPDLVIADIGTRTVTWGDLADAIREMPPIASTIPFPQLYQSVLRRVIENKALASLGERTGMDKDPAIARRMKRAPDDVLAEAFLRRSLAPNITDKALREVYDKEVANKPGPDEVRIRLIMVDQEEEAAYVIQKLKAGGDFATLARDMSKDATAHNGGDLGYARRDLLAPEIGAVAFSLAPGQMTAYPLKSGDHWFVIRVEERIHKPAPSFEEAKSALADDVTHAVIGELKRMAVGAANVKYHAIPDTTAPNTEAKAPPR
jgi:peptidyl-prolyl cis-trans isomerase C